MKKSLVFGVTIGLFLISLTLVSALDEGYYVVYDSKASTNDLNKAVLLISSVTLSDTGKDFMLIQSSELTQTKLENSFSVFIYSGNALIIIGDNASSFDVSLSASIASVLNNLRIPHSIVLTSEITRLDFVQAMENADFVLSEETIPPPVTREIFPTTKIEPSEEPVAIPSEEDIAYICGGCELENKCYPFGFRKDNKYCSDKNNQFVEQVDSDSLCDNNFECGSNVCVSGKCVSASLIAKIIGWFKNLFG